MGKYDKYEGVSTKGEKRHKKRKKDKYSPINNYTGERERLHFNNPSKAVKEMMKDKVKVTIKKKK